MSCQQIFLCFTIILLVGFANGQNEQFKLSVVHINDFHARYEETNDSGGTCKSSDTKCIGGFSRMYKQIKSMLNEYPESLLLDGGDSFQGTMWYTVGKWNLTQQYMNKLPFHASVLGNHEFEDGIDGVVPYIKALQHPVVVSNMDSSLEPSINGLYKNSIIITKNGRKIGIIGVIASDTDKLANTGNLKFLPESASVNAEAERLVQDEGVFTNIILSHSGYEVDQAIAANASEKISLIVGAHSHTFLYTGDNPPGPDEVRGPYPTIVKSRYGHDILVTQASSYCKYVGNITIFLDENGEIVSYSGAPIFLDTNFTKDNDINTELLPWKSLVDAEGGEVWGSSLVTLSKTGCYTDECTLGNFVADTMVYAYTNITNQGYGWTSASIAVALASGLRTDIGKGNITYSDILESLPYENTYDVGHIEGKYLKEAFENSLNNSAGMLQVSGIKLLLNYSRPVGDRVQSLKVRCQNCTIPRYFDLNLDWTYRIVVLSFLREGNGGYPEIANNLKNVSVGPKNFDIYQEYLRVRSPVFQEMGRIVIINKEGGNSVNNLRPSYLLFLMIIIAVNYYI